MEEQSPTRRVLIEVVEGRRQRGRPKLRCEDGVTEDARKLGERNWRNAARNMDSWQKLLKKALAQKGLLCQWWWWWIHIHRAKSDCDMEEVLWIFLIHYWHIAMDITLHSLQGPQTVNVCTYQAQLPQRCLVQVLFSRQMAHQGQPVCCGTQYCVIPVHIALSQCCLLLQHAAPHPIGSLPAACSPQWRAQLHKKLQSMNTFISKFTHSHTKSKLQ